jgi:hypothetical protein
MPQRRVFRRDFSVDRRGQGLLENSSDRTVLCGKQNSEDKDVQSHTRGCSGRFFLHSKKKGGLNTVKTFKVLSGLFVALLFLVTAQTAMAQSTIFNIPTTDTVSKGKAYFEFDWLMQAPGLEITGTGDTQRLYIYNPRFIVGVTPNAEVGVNFPILHNANGASPNTLGYIQPNFKYKYYNNDDAGVALAAGIVWNTPLNERDISDSWGYIYTNLSKKFKGSMYGPRFTAGPYGVLGANQDATQGPTSFLDQPRAGAIVGYEQPIHAKASFVADWFSGKNGLGYFTPGISITLPGNGLLNAGYSFGNDSWKDSNANRNRLLFIYYGVTF